MAVTGVAMLLFLVAHMAGNLKIFFGAEEFNSYAHFLRIIGEPLVPHQTVLWALRIGLVVCVVLHIVAAYQLSRRDIAARGAKKYQHRQRAKASFATRTMRWGGILIALFVIYHLLDLTTLTVNPRGVEGEPYQNLVASFSVWYVAVFYIIAMLALSGHIHHGFWSAAQTLGANKPRTERGLKFTAGLLSVVLTVGFISVPVAVLVGIVQ